MQIILHPSMQETGTIAGTIITESNVLVTSLIITITQISLNTGGNIVFKVQHSADQQTWIDVPNLITGNITSVGSVTISLSSIFALADNFRVVCTFSNALSVTFTAFICGIKY